MLAFAPNTTLIQFDRQPSKLVLSDLIPFLKQKILTPEILFKSHNQRIHYQYNFCNADYNIAEVKRLTAVLANISIDLIQEDENNLHHIFSVLAQQKTLLTSACDIYKNQIESLGFNPNTDEFYKKIKAHQQELDDYIMNALIFFAKIILEKWMQGQKYFGFKFIWINLSTTIHHLPVENPIKKTMLDLWISHTKLLYDDVAMVGKNIQSYQDTELTSGKIKSLKNEKQTLLSQLAEANRQLQSVSKITMENSELRKTSDALSTELLEEKTQQLAIIEDLTVTNNQLKLKVESLKTKQTQAQSRIKQLENQQDNHSKKSSAKPGDVSGNLLTSSVTEKQAVEIKYLKQQLSYYKMRLVDLKKKYHDDSFGIDEQSKPFFELKK